MKILEVLNLNKSFSNKKIIDDVSFSINSGEILGFVGPNGAGKTTVIKMILGLLHADSGEILINGQNIKKDYEKALEKVGGIIEIPEFYKYLSGYDNLKLFCEMNEHSVSDLSEIISYVGLAERINDKVKTYSLGMKQRLGLAQSLLSDPSLIILDEPTNGLDPAGIKSLRDTLKGLAKKGCAVMVSSHQLAEMELMCDNVCIIDKGKIVKIDSIENLKAEDEEEEFNYTVEVNDVQAALKLLPEMNVKNTSSKQNVISFTATKKSASNAARYLLFNNVEIYSLVAETKSLEDAFIEATNN